MIGAALAHRGWPQHRRWAGSPCARWSVDRPGSCSTGGRYIGASPGGLPGLPAGEATSSHQANTRAAASGIRSGRIQYAGSRPAGIRSGRIRCGRSLSSARHSLLHLHCTVCAVHVSWRNCHLHSSVQVCI